VGERGRSEIDRGGLGASGALNLARHPHRWEDGREGQHPHAPTHLPASPPPPPPLPHLPESPPHTMGGGGTHQHGASRWEGSPSQEEKPLTLPGAGGGGMDCAHPSHPQGSCSLAHTSPHTAPAPHHLLFLRLPSGTHSISCPSLAVWMGGGGGLTLSAPHTASALTLLHLLPTSFASSCLTGLFGNGGGPTRTTPRMRDTALALLTLPRTLRPRTFALAHRTAHSGWQAFPKVAGGLGREGGGQGTRK